MFFVRNLAVVALLAWATSGAHSSEQALPTVPAAEAGFVHRAANTIDDAMDSALNLIGIRYRRGGQNPETGFDCSGFVGHVFQESLGLVLPRSAKEISKTGDTVARNELKPGDLVFFNTMRKAFSHVGIYLGEGMFVHAPRSGGKIRVEDMQTQYWVKRYNGARRLTPE